jgi:REP element-mobilizing transposase RayT
VAVPRPPRIWLAGGLYHVFSRGSNRCSIFAYDTDRVDMLQCAGRAFERHGLTCLVYALMPNHHHWLLRLPEADFRLSAALKELNGRYSLRFNRRYRRDAHLFKNRFGAKLQASQKQLLWTIRYIVRNPVEANLCNDPIDYPWSSHRATLGLDPAPSFLDVPVLLSYLGDTPEQARERYAELISAPDEEPVSDTGVRAVTTDPSVIDQAAPVTG